MSTTSGLSITRDATEAALAAAEPGGSIWIMAGLPYRADSTKTGAASATSDLGVDGLVPAGEANLRHFGAPQNGLATDSPALQRAMTVMGGLSPIGGVIKTSGLVYSTDTVQIGSESRLDFGKSFVSLNASSVNFGMGWQTASIVSNPEIIGGQMIMAGTNSVAFAVGYASQPLFRDIGLTMQSAGQTGFRIVADDTPLSPYYGVMDNIRVSGNGTPGAGQTAIVMEPKPVLGSISVNRWVINNIRHIAAVDVGLDIRGVDGIVFNNVNLEGCYKNAIRFGYDNRSCTATVTTGGQIGGFTASGLTAYDLDPSGTIRIISGPNAGESMVVSSIDFASGVVIFPYGFPYKFTAGDQFIYTEAKARGVEMTNVTYEGSAYNETFVEFTAGSRSCRVRPSFITMPTGKVFTRAVEDMSNTIAERYEVYSFEATLSSIDGVEWLTPANTSTNAGGVMPSIGGWIDAVIVTGEVRGPNTPGEIQIDVFANSVDQNLPVKLTQDNPVDSRRIRKELLPSQMIGMDDHLKVRATKSGMTLSEHVRVEVHIGYGG
jgi:hypothetical protein